MANLAGDSYRIFPAVAPRASPEDPRSLPKTKGTPGALKCGTDEMAGKACLVPGLPRDYGENSRETLAGRLAGTLPDKGPGAGGKMAEGGNTSGCGVNDGRVS